MKLRRKLCSIVGILLLITSVAGCGGQSDDLPSIEENAEPITDNPFEEEAEETPQEESTESEVKIPEGMYLSEMTGEPIDESLRNQRPIAVMVDNEKTALTAYGHYGVADADVVYEIMNSTANGRITRLMVMIKDWDNVELIGNIRSARPTNILLAAEWNAVLCHDGGPFHNDAYFAQPYAKEHLSGRTYFSDFVAGKTSTQSEYIKEGDLDNAFEKTGFSRTYNEFASETEAHFNFAPYGTEVHLEDTYENAIPVKEIILPFPHNQSKLVYNEDTETYDYYEYGSIHKDGDGKVATFKNVIIQDCTFNQLDANGYLIYNVISGVGQPAYYVTNGYAKDLGWHKEPGATDRTIFFDENGDEIMINTGKTYIGLIPSDGWDDLELNE